MGTVIVLGVIVLGGFLIIVIISLLSMAQRGEQVYDLMYHGKEIISKPDSHYRPTSETPLPLSSGEPQPQRDFSASVAGP